MNDIDIDVNVIAWKIGPVIIMRGTATPTAMVSHPECFGRLRRHRPLLRRRDPQVHAPRRHDVRQALRMRTPDRQEARG